MCKLEFIRRYFNVFRTSEIFAPMGVGKIFSRGTIVNFPGAAKNDEISFYPLKTMRITFFYEMRITFFYKQTFFAKND